LSGQVNCIKQNIIKRWCYWVKYLGDKHRGFTVLTARPKTGRAVAGECNYPRPSHKGSVGINIRTPDASVRVGGSTPPDDSRRTTPKARILRGIAFPSCLSQRRIKVFNSSLWVSDCTYSAIVVELIFRWPSPSGASGSRDVVSRHHGNLRFPYDPEALDLFRL